MLTQATPAIVKALQGVLPPNAVKQLTQALGNCNQPLTHRGDVNFQPDYSLGNNRGVYGSNGTAPWNPGDYRDLMPGMGDNYYIDVAQPGGPNIDGRTFNNYGGNQYDFSTRQQFNVSNFYGGAVTNIGGDIVYNNTYTESPGKAGEDGAAGKDGRDGFGFPGPPGAPGAAGAAGRDGRDGRNGRDGVDGLDGLANARIDSISVPQYRAIIGSIPIPTNAIRGGHVTAHIPNNAISGITTNAISGGSVTIPMITQAITDVQGTVDIPATSAPTVTYDKATGVSGGTVSVPSNAISGGTVTYDKATGVSGGSAAISLPTPSGTVSVSLNGSNRTVLTGVSASFNSSTCTVTLTPTTTTIFEATSATATFTGTSPGTQNISVSGMSLTHTSTNASVTGTPASTSNQSVTGLSLTHTSTNATVSGGSSGGTYTIDTQPTYATPTDQTFSVDGTPATNTPTPATTTAQTLNLTTQPATTDPRSVCTGLATQNPIEKTFYAP